MNDVRPIDANALKKSITDYHAGLFPRYISKLVDAEIEDIKDIIDEQITLDYAPVRHGEWIEKIEPYAYTAAGREIHIFHCSACNFTWANRRMVFEYFKYCPNCGAKMEKDG